MQKSSFNTFISCTFLLRIRIKLVCSLCFNLSTYLLKTSALVEMICYNLHYTVVELEHSFSYFQIFITKLINWKYKWKQLKEEPALIQVIVIKCHFYLALNSIPWAGTAFPAEFQLWNKPLNHFLCFLHPYLIIYSKRIYWNNHIFHIQSNWWIII